MVRMKPGEVWTDESGKTWTTPNALRYWPLWFWSDTLVQATVEGTVVITTLQVPPLPDIATYHCQCDTEEEAAQLAAQLTLEWALR